MTIATQVVSVLLGVGGPLLAPAMHPAAAVRSPSARR